MTERLEHEGQPVLSVTARNRRLVGELVVHYPERDVRVELDGDAALRVMAIFAGTGSGSLQDPLHPSVSDAFNGWLALDTDTPLAMTWVPPHARAGRRTTVDPASAA